tara:strand:+ start:787 stop:1485 length:699 start_codon:yes stop_codon:yes gene_type:complete
MNNKSLNFVVILTTTVNTSPNVCCVYQKKKEQRLKTYLKSIEFWIKKTNVSIVVVENSGYPFDEFNELKDAYSDRLEFITFNNSRQFLNEHDYIFLNNGKPHQGRSKGQHELYAINKVFTSSILIRKLHPDFIIKITGRYYIPNFENILNRNLDEDTSILVQNNQDECMVLGCKTEFIGKLFEFPSNQTKDFIENVYKERIKDIPGNKLVLPRLQLEWKTQQGGVNKVHGFI